MRDVRRLAHRSGEPGEEALETDIADRLLAESNSGTAKTFAATTSDKIDARHIAQHSIRNFECRKARPSKYACDGCGRGDPSPRARGGQSGGLLKPRPERDLASTFRTLGSFRFAQTPCDSSEDEVCVAHSGRRRFPGFTRRGA